jgi:large subunit ribosomal protein L18
MNVSVEKPEKRLVSRSKESVVRIVLKRNTAEKAKTRLRTKARLRKKIYGTPERPRLSVFKSARYIYAQLVDDVTGKTLAHVTSLKMKPVKGEGKVGVAKNVGLEIAKAAGAKNINQIVFDRNGFIYHGRIKAVADGAREGGLKF